MPEGDTLFRTATTLHAALAGRPLVRVEAALPAIAKASLVGQVVSKVLAHGKHLYIHLADGRAVRTHLRMTGSFHVYRPGERWREQGHLMRYLLANQDYEVVCFAAPDVEVLPPGGAEQHASTLGPDLLAVVFDGSEAEHRLRQLGALAIGEALLVQQAVAGIGNIYKSEVLFVCRTNPFAPTSELSSETISHLLDTARRLMQANCDGRPRKTRAGPGNERLWVYDRVGRPCLVCGEAIQVRRQGPDARRTYFCARCQGVG